MAHYLECLINGHMAPDTEVCFNFPIRLLPSILGLLCSVLCVGFSSTVPCFCCGIKVKKISFSILVYCIDCI